MGKYFNENSLFYLIVFGFLAYHTVAFSREIVNIIQHGWGN